MPVWEDRLKQRDQELNGGFIGPALGVLGKILGSIALSVIGSKIANKITGSGLSGGSVKPIVLDPYGIPIINGLRGANSTKLARELIQAVEAKVGIDNIKKELENALKVSGIGKVDVKDLLRHIANIATRTNVPVPLNGGLLFPA